MNRSKNKRNAPPTGADKRPIEVGNDAPFPEMLGFFEVPKPAHLAKRGADRQPLRPSVGLGEDQPHQGYYRPYVDDPFGNRIELMTAGHMI